MVENVADDFAACFVAGVVFDYHEYPPNRTIELARRPNPQLKKKALNSRSNRENSPTLANLSLASSKVGPTTYWVEHEGEKHLMIFDRDVYDQNPEIGFITYWHPVFEGLPEAGGTGGRSK